MHTQVPRNKLSNLKGTFKQFDINQIRLYMERNEAGKGCMSVALFFQLFFMCELFQNKKGKRMRNRKSEVITGYYVLH